MKELSQRWQHGPGFLYLPEDERPEKPSITNADDIERECLKVQVSCTAAKVEGDVIDCERFSSWRRLVRVTAYVLRFIQNLRNCVKKLKADFQLSPLSVQELDEAEIYWIKRAQNDLKNELVKRRYHKLSLFTDEFGIIRVGGRIDKALTSYDSRHPILLPRKQWLSTLLTRQTHQFGHSGAATTVAKLRKRFWIIRDHDLAKSVKFRCTFCRQMEVKVESKVMADLPKCRLAPFTPPFHHTSCDYFGPFSVKISRNKTAKHYGVIFTV